jgi:tight adherence protein C
MMYWWMDLVFVVALVVLVWAIYRMHHASETELEQSDSTGTEVDVKESLEWLFPKRLIRQAGMVPANVSLAYWIGKLILTILLPLLVAEATGTLSAFPFVVLALVGFGLVDLWLLAVRKKRRRAIERSLGYFIDLIAAFLKSGMSLSQAFRQASEYGLPKKNPLAREVNLVARELDAGSDREAAFNSLAERTGVKDLQRLAAVMNVGFRVGAPITETLEGQSALLRAKQWEQAESMVSRKALEALFPMLLVSIPLLLVLVFFPAFVQIQQIFKLFSGSFG